MAIQGLRSLVRDYQGVAGPTISIGDVSVISTCHRLPSRVGPGGAGDAAHKSYFEGVLRKTFIALAELVGYKGRVVAPPWLSEVLEHLPSRLVPAPCL
eukprot:3790284-Prymnesium_polylepis.1